MSSTQFSPPLYVEESGTDGSNLIFLPGLGGTTRYWQGRVAPLEHNYHVILVDPLGFGRSPKPRTRYTAEQHVGALHQSIARYAPFTLIGHSMGAILAIAYAVRYPQEVEGLILIGLPYFGDRGQRYSYFHNRPFPDRWIFTNLTLATIACVVTRRVFGRILPYLLRDMPREIAEDLVKHTWYSFTSSLWEVIYGYDLKTNVDRLDKRFPVYCIHGDRDQTAPLAGVQSLAYGRSNWGLKILPGIDHHPLLRTPETCIESIADVLAKPVISSSLYAGSSLTAEKFSRLSV